MCVANFLLLIFKQSIGLVFSPTDSYTFCISLMQSAVFTNTKEYISNPVVTIQYKVIIVYANSREVANNYFLPKYVVRVRIN